MVRRAVLSYWANGLIALLSFFLLFWSYRTGIESGMADSLSKVSAARADFAIATAISRLGYGATGYIIYAPIHQLYLAGSATVYEPTGPRRDINQGIENALGRPLDLRCEADHPGVCMDDWGDDKGYSDYMIGAFLIFGFNVQALYNFYFLVMSISLLAFIAHFFRDVGDLLFAPLFLAAHHLAMTLLPTEQVTSVVHDAHFVPAVACLAAIHVAIVLIRRQGSGLLALPFLLVQIGVVVLAIDSRSSSIWLIYFPIAAFLLWLPWRRGLSGIVRFGFGRSHLVALVLCVPLILSAYKNLAYDQRYTTSGVTGHLVWHALYMGLSVHPDAMNLYNFRYTDGTSYLAAYRYIRKHPNIINGIDKRVMHIRQDEQSWGNLIDFIGWSSYERVVKEMYLEFVAENPRYVAESSLIFKPKYLVEQILWHLGLKEAWPSWVSIEKAHLPLGRTTLDYLSFPVGPVVILSFILARFGGGRRKSDRWIGLSVLLFVMSLMPSILVAPIHYELPLVFVPFGMMLYMLGGALGTMAILSCSRRRFWIAGQVDIRQPDPRRSETMSVSRVLEARPTKD